MEKEYLLGYEKNEWYQKLTKEQKKYIRNHPNPSHMLVFLKKNFSFEKSLMRGYENHVNEEMNISS